MPALPLIYAGLAHTVGDRAKSVALAKVLLTNGILTASIFLATRKVKVSLGGVFLVYLLYFGPQALKHGASLDYEEGLLIDLQLSLALLFSAFLIAQEQSAIRWRIAVITAAVILAELLYFIKTTTLLMLLVIGAAFALQSNSTWRYKGFFALLLSFPFFFWGYHTYRTTAHISLSSSWNGSNLLRGFNSDSMAIYPQVSLDRIFDSKFALLDDRTRVELGHFTDSKCYPNEWAWSRDSTAKAKAWATSSPLDAVKFTGTKLWAALLEIRHTPYRVSATDTSPDYSAGVAFILMAWMFLARAVSGYFLFLLVRGLTRKDRSKAVWTLALLVAGFAPYLIVFNYQRHIVPLLVMSAGAMAVLYFSASTARNAGTR